MCVFTCTTLNEVITGLLHVFFITEIIFSLFEENVSVHIFSS